MINGFKGGGVSLQKNIVGDRQRKNIWCAVLECTVLELRSSDKKW